MKKILIIIMVCMTCFVFGCTDEDDYNDAPGTENDGIEP